MQRIFLVGLSGSGKSTVGPLVARLLGWRFLDTDDLITEQTGLTVAQIFHDRGEAYFRQLESEILHMAAQRERSVIATGGGAVIAEANRRFMQTHGLTVYLHTSAEVAWQRIQTCLAQTEAPAIRPLLAGTDGQRKLHALYQARQSWYEEAPLHIDTDAETPEHLARQIIAGAIASGTLHDPLASPEQITLDVGRASSQAIVAWGGLCQLPHALEAAGLPRRILIITDSTVGRFYARPVQALLRQAGFAPQVFTIPAGESSKSFQSFKEIIDWLVQERAEQQEAILALGGGVVGDLAGFVASCYHRGVPLVQVPTTLLAQVDAAIGGKTGINHPHGKNLIGTFYQPRLIFVDPACLLTLSDRVYREGWAEIIKYGMALDTLLFEQLERAGALQPNNHTLLSSIIARCIRLKMQVVQEDERDQGQRAILNYGHTFGHALEAATEYTTWLHGEAVAIGMEVAAQIAVAQGLLAEQDAARQRALLCTYGLPITCSDVEVASLLAAMQQDKKVRNGQMRWILPSRVGQAAIYGNIPPSVVQQAIETVLARTKEGETKV